MKPGLVIARAQSDCELPALARSDANRLLHWLNEDLPIADLARGSLARDGTYDGIGFVFWSEPLEEELGHEGDLVGAAAKDFPAPSAPPRALDRDDGQTAYPDEDEPLDHGIESLFANDGLNFLDHVAVGSSFSPQRFIRISEEGLPFGQDDSRRPITKKHQKKRGTVPKIAPGNRLETGIALTTHKDSGANGHPIRSPTACSRPHGGAL
jgi:hypothetical protein